MRASFCPAPLPLIILLIGLGAPARAARGPGDDDHALPCRPTITCTADITPPGALEFELGYITRRTAGPQFQHSFPLLIKLTLAEWVQFQVATNGMTFTAADAPNPLRYFDNVALGLKFHLEDQGPGVPSMSLSAALSLPTPAGQTGYTPDYDATFVLYLSKDFRRLHVDANAGLNLLRLQHLQPQGYGSMVLSVGLPKGFGLMLEGYVFSDARPTASPDAGVLLAESFAPRPWLVIDLGADAGLYQSLRSFSLFGGVTVLAAELWERRRRRQPGHKDP